MISNLLSVGCVSFYKCAAGLAPKDTCKRALSFLDGPLFRRIVWLDLFAVRPLRFYFFPFSSLSLILQLLIDLLSFLFLLFFLFYFPFLSWPYYGFSILAYFHNLFALEQFGLCYFQMSSNKLWQKIFIEGACFQGFRTEKVTLVFHPKVWAR